MKNLPRPFCRSFSHCSKTSSISAVAVAWNQNKKYCKLDHASCVEIGFGRRIKLLPFLCEVNCKHRCQKQGRGFNITSDIDNTSNNFTKVVCSGTKPTTNIVCLLETFSKVHHKEVNHFKNWDPNFKIGPGRFVDYPLVVPKQVSYVLWVLHGTRTKNNTN